MNFFKERGQENQKPGDVSAGLPRQGDVLSEPLKAHSRFIKRVSCSQCGAAKSLPSFLKTYSNIERISLF